MKTDIKTFKMAYMAPSCSVHNLASRQSVATGSCSINKLGAEDADDEVIDF